MHAATVIIATSTKAHYVTAVMLSEASNDCELCNDAERCAESERWPSSQLNHVSVRGDLKRRKRFIQPDIDNNNNKNYSFDFKGIVNPQK